MKLLTLSDIHGQFRDFDPLSLPEADVVLIGGDITNLGMRRMAEVALAEQWMTALAARYPHILYVLGNHDLGLTNPYFERIGPTIRNIAQRNATIADNTPEGDGLSFVGADLSPCFDLPGLAQTWERMTAGADVDTAYFDALPATTEVVVSHCPPFGLLDEFRQPGSGHHLGSPGLRRYIEKNQPRLVVCGHIHEGSGEIMLGDTRIINVARRHQLIEIDP